MNSGRRVRRAHGSPIAQDPAAVRQARENAGKQQQELAAEIGISAPLMCEIETGRRSATPPTLAALATALDVDITHLRRKDQTHTCPTCAAQTATAG
ncbi:helix-turn-helix domain-containing protein [Embleya sp. NPDC050154]|uniref:helix-turn-helix domain-containing protein n=1 Tax=Embleya sp. NPDC050154 TaxID=3363988 RepID=UPI0037A5D888